MPGASSWQATPIDTAVSNLSPVNTHTCTHLRRRVLMTRPRAAPQQHCPGWSNSAVRIELSWVVFDGRRAHLEACSEEGGDGGGHALLQPVLHCRGAEQRQALLQRLCRRRKRSLPPLQRP